MRLLLLASIASAIGAATTYSHAAAVHHTPVYRIGMSDTLSPDSLQLLYRQIDQLSVFDLKKVRESYIYRNRTQPSDQNKRILLYVEERIKGAQ